MNVNIIKIVPAVFIIICIITMQNSTYSQTLFVDDFIYPAGNLSGQGGWNIGGVSSPNKITVSSPGLNFTGYQGSGYGNTALCNNPFSGEILYKNFTASQSTGNVYMALMINVTTLSDSASQGFNVAMNPSGGSTNITAKLYVKKVSTTTYNFGVGKAGTNGFYSNNVYNTNTTYLAIIKYSFIDGSSTNDSCSLFIFNSNIPSTEPASTLSTIVGNDAVNVGQVIISNNYAGGSSLKGSIVKIDGIRVGKTWLETIITGINIISTEIPDRFYLFQNYPNPFNPSTKIKFTLPSEANVSLKIFDVTGKQVTELVNGILLAGIYEYTFDALKLSSGIYFYRIESKDFTMVKKMMLVK